MLLYAIVDGTVTDAALARLLAQSVDYIQLRDKTLPAGELAATSTRILAALAGSPTRFLINARADVAVATGAHGVHLTARREELLPAQVCSLFAHAKLPPPVISVSAHDTAEVERAFAGEADLILFAPVFEKRITGELVTPGRGLEALTDACLLAAPTPVLALGGITPENAAACEKAGAAGIAGIRLFA